jgi:hypothetical protein
MIPETVFRLRPAGRAGLTLYEITNPPRFDGKLGVIGVAIM